MSDFRAGIAAASRPEPTARLQRPLEAVVAASTGSFAELPRVPGEVILRNPPAVAAIVPERTDPPTLPASLPPTVMVQTAPPVDPPLVAALRAYLNEKPDAAAEALKPFDAANRDLLTQLLPASVRIARTNFAKESPSEIGALATQLETPLQMLSPRVPLSLTKTLFCTEIKGFGRYRAVPEGSPLRAGELIHVYAELRNVPCLPVDAGTPQERYVTDLRTSLRVRDAAGTAVPLLQANGEYGPVRNERRREETESPIRDHHLFFLFTLPRKPGAYTVHVEIIDPANGRHLSAVMPLRVGG